MSEHTTEYALVPNFIAHVAGHFPRVIPMYFWSTREGSRIADESMGGQRVRAVAAYARRPKVFGSDQCNILVKINTAVFAAASEGSKFGIPVFAGVPLVTSLSDFSIGVPCCWFHLGPTSPEKNDYEFLIPLSVQASMSTLDPSISGPLTREQIIDVVKSQSREILWEEAVVGMRTIRKSGRQYAASPFAMGYRPFFLVVLT